MLDTPHLKFSFDKLSIFAKLNINFYRVLSWYEEDLFDPSSKAGRNLQAVRRMHRAVRDKMKNCDPCVVQERSTLESTMSCPLAPRLCADLTGVEEPLKECEEKVWVNQVDMAFTQFG